MVIEVKVRKVGNSFGLILPKAALAHLKVGEGDSLCLTEGPDDSLRLTPSNSDVARQMEIARDVMDRYRNALRELAK